jgi:hypothetical protein
MRGEQACHCVPCFLQAANKLNGIVLAGLAASIAAAVVQLRNSVKMGKSPEAQQQKAAVRDRLQARLLAWQQEGMQARKLNRPARRKPLLSQVEVVRSSTLALRASRFANAHEKRPAPMTCASRARAGCRADRKDHRACA